VAILVVLAEGGGGIGANFTFIHGAAISKDLTRPSGTYNKLFFKSGLYSKGLISVKTYKCSK
jgi:hypothetical protein